MPVTRQRLVNEFQRLKKAVTPFPPPPSPHLPQTKTNKQTTAEKQPKNEIKQKEFYNNCWQFFLFNFYLVQ